MHLDFATSDWLMIWENCSRHYVRERIVSDVLLDFLVILVIHLFLLTTHDSETMCFSCYLNGDSIVNRIILANSCWTSTLRIKIPSLPRDIKYLLRLVLLNATCITTTSVLYVTQVVWIWIHFVSAYSAVHKSATCAILKREKWGETREDSFNRSAIRAWTLTTLALIAASPLFRHRFGELFGDGPSESPDRARRIERKAQLGRASEWPFFSNRKASRGAHMTSRTTVRECFSFVKAIDRVSILTFNAHTHLSCHREKMRFLLK